MVKSALPRPPLGKLTEEERQSSVFSKTLQYQMVPVMHRGRRITLQVGIMGPPEKVSAGKDQEPVPVALCISGERQKHVSKFFQAFVPERRGWITLTPLLPEGEGRLKFFDEPCDELVRQLAELALARFPVEGGKFHVLGTSNGGTTTMRFGCKWPELCHSLTVVTGTMTRADEARAQAGRLSGLPVHIYCGDQDELGFYEAGVDLHRFLNGTCGITPKADLSVLPGAGHFTIGEYIDMHAFWARLESLRPQGASAQQAGAPAAPAAAAPAAPKSAPPQPGFPEGMAEGTKVELHGLKREELNGSCGVVIRMQGERVGVKMEGKKEMAFKVENLRLVEGQS
eukprot:TRINITY_DN2365_c3_g1_i1.p1 TRINITY_DN2365_c3_g1~~TRINITY_DN2365_c3_g1_i1.p1  ORF type:complete len:341 (+),score=55.70 TRINITY_DN2365_c3_g1_i1:104-1126(+)